MEGPVIINKTTRQYKLNGNDLRRALIDYMITNVDMPDHADIVIDLSGTNAEVVVTDK
jgi:hypothetical protein